MILKPTRVVHLERRNRKQVQTFVSSADDKAIVLFPYTNYIVMISLVIWNKTDLLIIINGTETSTHCWTVITIVYLILYVISRNVTICNMGTTALPDMYAWQLGLSDIIVLAIYRDILKVLISRYFLINYRDTIPVHYCH